MQQHKNGILSACFSRLRVTRRLGNAVIALALTIGLLSAPAPAQAFGERSLKLFFTHTGETLEITFKRNGRYIPSALKELNRFLRDWRRNESIDMDPELFDLLWQIQTTVGKGRTIHVVSGYRSPATNNMLRSRSRGVAKFSQHMAGKACDFFIPGVPTATIRKAAFKLQIGGVGYYPTSRTPFVHLDTGSVRSWPRMTRTQLLALFPDGKTVHIPSDGKPLQGYELAKAELAARDRQSRTQIASASSGGGVGLFGGRSSRSRDTQARPESSGSGKNIITALLTRDDDDVEDTVERQVTAEERARPTRATAPLPGVKSSLPGASLTAPTNEKPQPKAAPAAEAKAAPQEDTQPSDEASQSAPPPVPTVRPEIASPAEATPAAPEAPAVPNAAPEAEPAAEALLVAALPKPRPAGVRAPAAVVGGTPADAEAAVASLRASLGANAAASELPGLGYAAGSAGAAPADGNILSATAAIVGDTADEMPITATATPDLPAGSGFGGTDPTATFFGPPDRSDSRFLIGASSMRTMEFAWLSHPNQGNIGIITAARAPMGGSGALTDDVGGWRTDRFEGVMQLYITQAYAAR